MLREIGLPRFHMPLHALIANVRLGWPLMIEMIVDFVLSTSDRYLIAAFLSIAFVGEYQPAYTLATLPMFLQTISDPLLTPAVSRLIDRGDRVAAEHMIAVFVRLFMMIVIPFAVGALMIGPSILGLLATPAIGMAGRWVVPLVAVATGFFGIMRFASLVAFVLGRTRLMVAPVFLGASINVGLNLLLIPLLKNITVAGVTTLLGYAASAIYACVLLHGEWRVVIDFKSVLRFSAAAAVMGGALWLLGYSPGAVAGMGIPYLVGAVASGIVVYFSVLWALGGFGRRELDQLGSLLRQRIPRGGEAI
jgi:O-antigen/teichoic acid export membrane protein